MDKTVPAGAAILLDFIRQIETGRSDSSAYDVIYGHNERNLLKRLTLMTIDEIIGAGPVWTARYKSSAAGAYQFMNATLKDLRRELGLGGAQVFDPNLQDRLGYHLLKRRGYDEFMAGQINAVEFGKRLAQEWASLPVLAATKGGSRQVVRGQSYYAGDGLNKSLVKPEAVEAILREAKAAAVIAPQPIPPPPDIPTHIPPAPPHNVVFPGWLWAVFFGLLIVLGILITTFLPIFK